MVEGTKTIVTIVAIVTIVTIKRILNIPIMVTIVEGTKEFGNQTMEKLLMEKCGN